MTGARISFTCDTIDDQDVIIWLDSFGNRERGFAVKAAIRHYIDMEQGNVPEVEIDRLTAIENKISDIFSEVVSLRKQTHSQALALSINNDIINTDLSKVGKVDPAVESNIGKLLD